MRTSNPRKTLKQQGLHSYSAYIGPASQCCLFPPPSNLSLRPCGVCAWNQTEGPNLGKLHRPIENCPRNHPSFPSPNNGHMGLVFLSDRCAGGGAPFDVC